MWSRPKGAFPLLLASNLALVGCGLSSLFSSDDDDSGGNGTPGVEPSYTGEYAGSVDVSNAQTGESWVDLAADLTVTYEESDGDLTVTFSIFGLPAAGDREDGMLTGCSPGPSFVICSDRQGSQLLGVELTFSSSTATGRITDSREQPDGQFKLELEANGNFTKR